VLIFLLVVFRIICNSDAIQPLYGIAFIFLFVQIPLNKYIAYFLLVMGKRSTGIWLIHTYFIYYIFHDFTYSFKYPVLIFAVITTVCFCVSAVIDSVYNKFCRLIFHE
jgi:hypothetical protein